MFDRAGFIPRRIKGEGEGVIERGRLRRCTVTCMPEHAQQHDTINKGFNEMARTLWLTHRAYCQHSRETFLHLIVNMLTSV